jgi:hypothetical protein
MQPKRRRPEHTLQVKLMKYLSEYAYPEMVYFAVSNGELRHIRVALRLKAEGVLPGVPDVCFLLPYGKAGWLELKSRHGVVSDPQLGFAAKAKRLGHLWAFARTLNDAIIILKYWGVIKPNAPFPNESTAT